MAWSENDRIKYKLTKEEKAESGKKWRADNPDYMKKYKKRNYYIVRQIERREWYDNFKKTLKCEICGEDHPATIDFHHKDEKTKTNGITQMLSGNYSIKRIKEEIDKCQILCSNCHRKLHYEQETGSFGKRHERWNGIKEEKAKSEKPETAKNIYISQMIEKEEKSHVD